MRTCAFLLIVTLISFSFCPVIQQTLSAPAPTMQPAAAEVEDSELFLQQAMARKTPRRNYNREVSALLARVTTEEKIGQMTQLEIGMITKGERDNIQIDPEKLDKAVVKYGVGSILNVKDQALTVEKWHEIIGRSFRDDLTFGFVV